MTESKKNARLSTLLTGGFLVNPKVLKHWPYILFLCALALIMTTSSHNAERKVHRIAELRREMKELNSEFIDTRSRLMNESMESKVIEKIKIAHLQLQKGAQPPRLIKIEKGED
jgi:hypothetical protein